MVSFVQEAQLAGKGVIPGMPWLTKALHEGTLEHVYRLLDLAVAVNCIAAALLRCAALCCAMLCCAVLCCAGLSCAVLCYAALRCAAALCCCAVL